MQIGKRLKLKKIPSIQEKLFTGKNYLKLGEGMGTPSHFYIMHVHSSMTWWLCFRIQVYRNMHPKCNFIYIMCNNFSECYYVIMCILVNIFIWNVVGQICILFSIILHLLMSEAINWYVHVCVIFKFQEWIFQRTRREIKAEKVRTTTEEERVSKRTYILFVGF